MFKKAKIMSVFLFGIASLVMVGCGGDIAKDKETEVMETYSTELENEAKEIPVLKDTYKEYFDIGVAVAPHHIDEGAPYEQLINKHFNSIVAENVMKPEGVQPVEGTFTFSKGDQIVDYAKANDKIVRGHTLVWHQQTPAWMFEGENGDQVTREELIERMKTHITKTMEHYKGKVDIWDVVNEVVADNGGLRKSKYYDIIGPEYIEIAFRTAREADPDAKLFINDYSIEGTCQKRQDIYELVKDLVEEGVPIDGIGFQAHINNYFPTIDEIRETIHMFSELGLEVQFTELDVSIYTSKDEKTTEITEKVLERQAERYKELFDLFKEESEHITNVTLWGIADDISWLNNFPVKGRGDAPLLFDAFGEPKPAFWAITEE